MHDFIRLVWTDTRKGEFNIKVGVEMVVKTKYPFPLSDTCLAFYNTAPSPSGPSGIHCDLKPDTHNTTRSYWKWALLFPLFTFCSHLQFCSLMISIDGKFKMCPNRKETVSHRERNHLIPSLQKTLKAQPGFKFMGDEMNSGGENFIYSFVPLLSQALTTFI